MRQKNNLPHLSMGMSADYMDAIELNASYIRIGTALFGEKKMKTKLEIFSSQQLKFFFINLDSFFEIRLKSFDELETVDTQEIYQLFFLRTARFCR